MATKERRRFFPFTETKRVNPPNKMGDVEKQVYDMLQARLPNAKIEYESVELSIHIDPDHQRSTRPDFRIERNNSIYFLEITTSPINGSDPKKTQREIAQIVAPNVRYIVLYEHHLKKLARKHPSELTLPNKTYEQH